MDILILLKKDHQVVSQLFQEIEQAGEKAYKTRLKLFEKIEAELFLHTQIEETIFYPTLEKYEETESITMEAYEEHKLIKQLSDEIKDISSETEIWKAKVTVLQELVEHHMKEEEDDLFPKVKKIIALEDRKKLGEKMEEIKKKAGA